MSHSSRPFNGLYTGEHLTRVAFPLGGMGAGMICLEGAGALSHVSLCHRPRLKHEPLAFAALALKGQPNVARVLEGPLPSWKRYPGGPYAGGNSPYGGLPRFREVSFSARFPFARIELRDEAIPLGVAVEGWSPFEPLDQDNSSLPVAALEYTFFSSGAKEIEGVFSFHADNFMREHAAPDAEHGSIEDIRSTPGGFILLGSSPSKSEASLALWADDPAVKVDCAWHRGLEPRAMLWRAIAEGACFERSPVTDGPPASGASLFVPFEIAPGERKKIRLHLAWYVGRSSLRTAGGELFEFKSNVEGETYCPWYAGRFANLGEVVAYWREHYEALKGASQRFIDCFYSSTLPPEVLEAVSANLSILKSPTVLRQADGRLWGFEGSAEHEGHCPGSCTHVWNYAQAIGHLFPALERTLRETEFGANQNEEGHQVFRAALPIRAPELKDTPAAADGQLGGILKVYRDWRISSDTAWLKTLWPKVRASLDYCIRSFDPRHQGWLEEPHHHTYDLWFWAPNGMCTSLYLGALKAAVLIGQALQDQVAVYQEVLTRGIQKMESELFNGEYFYQKMADSSLDARFPDFYSDASQWLTLPLRARFATPEVVALAEREGPPYQYGQGCLADGVVGAWLAWVCGVGEVIDRQKVKSHLEAVHRYNFRRDLSAHPNAGRSSFAGGEEGGLVVCTWPKGNRPSSPMLYCDEVWTGVEYQVASHLMAHGLVEQGLQIVRAARSRYDGRTRNPFDEIEAGHWYARAMSSYALLQALSGARYDAVERVLYLEPAIEGDFRCFLCTAGGYGTVGVRDGKPFCEVVTGKIPYARIHYQARAHV